VGLVTDDDWNRLQRKEKAMTELTDHLRNRRHGQDSLEKVLRRTEVSWDQVCEMDPTLRTFNSAPAAVEQVVLEAKYSGYIDRQAAQVERFQRLESRPIPIHFDYLAVPQLRAEAKEKLTRIRPTNLGQAGRIGGITPADLAVVMMYLKSS
jgi:tRNA uridine 5-carboxymethylaminomethyl modification enzyme